MIAFLFPNADTAVNQWTPSTGTAHFSLVNTATVPTLRSPNPPSTSSFVSVSAGNTAIDEYDAGTVSGVSSVTKIIYTICAGDGGAFGTSDFKPALFLNGAWVDDSGVADISVSGDAAWYTYTFTGSWTQADLDAMKIRVSCQGTDVGCQVYAVYCLIVYTPTTLPAATGSALHFNGTLGGSGAFATAPVNIDLYANLTVACWAYPEGPVSDHYHVIWSNDDGGFDRALGAGNTGQPNWIINDGSQAFDTGIPVELNSWHHVALVYDTATITFYYDGAPIWDSGTPASGYAGTSTLHIANTPFNTNDNNFHGAIDEFRVYSASLSAATILAMYSGATIYGSAGEASLVVGYHLDEGTGTSLTDFSGNSNTGTISTATWTTGVVAVAHVSGYLGGYPGSAYPGQYVAVPSFAGSGEIAFSHPLLSGAGLVLAPVTGTGAVVIGPAILSGAGIENFTGSGAVIINRPILSGTGFLPVTATGAITIRVPALDGSGIESLAGSSAIIIGAPVLSGTGTVPEPVTGTGAVVIGRPILSNEPVFSSVFGGAGVIIGPPVLNGVGTVVFSPVETGAGSIHVRKPILSGAGTVTLAGTGRIIIGAPTLSGSGLGVEISGTGAVVIGAPRTFAHVRTPTPATGGDSVQWADGSMTPLTTGVAAATIGPSPMLTENVPLTVDGLLLHDVSGLTSGPVTLNGNKLLFVGSAVADAQGRIGAIVRTALPSLPVVTCF